MIVRPIPALGLYELVEALPYAGGEVPAGFRWNGASIPRLAWTPLGYTPFHPRLMRGTAGHDHDYKVRSGLRRVADERFRTTIIEDDVSVDDADLMFAVVREFGLRIWTNDPEDLAMLAQRAQAERRRTEDAP